MPEDCQNDKRIQAYTVSWWNHTDLCNFSSSHQTRGGHALWRCCNVHQCSALLRLWRQRGRDVATTWLTLPSVTMTLCALGVAYTLYQLVVSLVAMLLTWRFILLLHHQSPPLARRLVSVLTALINRWQYSSLNKLILYDRNHPQASTINQFNML